MAGSQGPARPAPDNADLPVDLGLDDEYDTEPFPVLGQWAATLGQSGHSAQRQDDPMRPPVTAAAPVASPLWNELASRTPNAAGGRARGAVAVTAAVMVAVGALSAWLLLRPPESPAPAAAPAQRSDDPTPAPTAAQSRLQRLLPAGYSPGACTPAPAPAHAVAKVLCTRNTDRGGPPAASYTLVAEKSSVRPVFDDIVRNSAIVTCPGNIQSPGPWRRNATPQHISGTLVCSYRAGRPAVSWTTDADLLVSDVLADADGPPLDELYDWWSAHS
ncbi:hypothetical protein [Mycobacterium sp. 29Ha]|uniref:hypothetical protein n=1 Tax=Mycobacterium sp. 29Ha TaxID=2939268 RepID=UPI002938D95A|nr:hypothetical protein [Mycobacterium sp. 29Ha]MDV3133365.1 hypothetical protein [Mycobacterium sp. 29Ha]